MDNKNDPQEAPQRQTPENPSGSPVANPFDNNRSSDEDIKAAGDDLDKEQQFKEALTERD